VGAKSAIEWTDATWKPVTGCTKVSLGVNIVMPKGLQRISMSWEIPAVATSFADALSP
jgi:protein gp37